MVYSKEIVREWLDEVAERAKDHPEWVDVLWLKEILVCVRPLLVWSNVR